MYLQTTTRTKLWNVALNMCTTNPGNEAFNISSNLSLCRKRTQASCCPLAPMLPVASKFVWCAKRCSIWSKSTYPAACLLLFPGCHSSSSLKWCLGGWHCWSPCSLFWSISSTVSGTLFSIILNFHTLNVFYYPCACKDYFVEFIGHFASQLWHL